MNDYRPDNTLSIISIVLGGLGFLLSLIPCIGFLSVPLAVIGLILGVIAYFKAKDNGDKKTLPIIALVISFLPLVISALWYFTLPSLSSNTSSSFEYMQNCDSLKIEIDKLESEIEGIEDELEDNETGSGVFGNITKITKLGIKMGKMQENAQDLGCDFYNNNGVITIDSLQSNSEIESSQDGNNSEDVEEDGN